MELARTKSAWKDFPRESQSSEQAYYQFASQDLCVLAGPALGMSYGVTHREEGARAAQPLEQILCSEYNM